MLDKITLDRINTLHPKIRKQVLDAYSYVNEKRLGKGVRLRFAYTFRTFAEQDALYAQGRTKPGKIVTNAKGGQSIHNYGLALDIVILYDLNNDGIFETASWDMLKDFDKNGQSDWMEVVNYFKSKGMTWGGDWNGFKDNPHFQIDFGLSWKEMKAIFDKGNYCNERINGVDYKYINI